MTATSFRLLSFRFTDFDHHFLFKLIRVTAKIGRSLVRFQLVSLGFFIDIISYGPGLDSASNRNEYQEYFLGVKSSRCVRLTTLPPSCAVVS